MEFGLTFSRLQLGKNPANGWARQVRLSLDTTTSREGWPYIGSSPLSVALSIQNRIDCSVQIYQWC
jgi:hypothetical protein